VLRASEASARKELGTLAPGADVVIYDNPRRPCDAVLLRGVTLGTLWFLAAGVLFITAGLNL
jgi:hypothetical protein